MRGDGTLAGTLGILKGRFLVPVERTSAVARRKHDEAPDEDARAQESADAGEALGDKPEGQPSPPELRDNESVRDAQLGTSIAGANAGTSVADTPKDDVSDDVEGAVASQVEAESASQEEQAAAGSDVADPNLVTSLAGANSGTSVGAAGLSGDYAGAVASEREVEGHDHGLGDPERVADPNLRTSLAGQNAFTSVAETPVEGVPAEIQGAVAAQSEANPGSSSGIYPNASQ